MRDKNLIKWISLALAVLILAVLQFTPHFMPTIMGARPIYLISAVVAIAMIEGETAGAAYGIAAGLIWDVQTGIAFGADAILLMFCGICTGLLIQFLFRKTVFTVVLFTAVSLLLYGLLSWFFVEYMRGSLNFVYCFLNIILPTTVYSLIFTLPLYYAFGYLISKTNREE